MKPLKIEIHYAFAQTLYWAAAVCISGFTALLLAYQGFSNSKIGLITSSVSILSILLQLLISAFCDHHPEIAIKKIISVMALVSFIFVGIIYVKQLPLLLVAVFFMLCLAPIKATDGLLNALFMQYQNKGIPVRFGWPRGVGSIGWALGAFFLGKLIEKYSPNVLWLIFLILDLFAIASYLLMPGNMTSEKKQKLGSHTSSYKEMLGSNAALRLFLLSLIVLGISQAALYTFLNRIIENLGGGASEQGIAILIQSGMELPAMFLSAALIKKWNAGKLLIFSFLCSAIKSLSLTFCSSLPMLYVIMLSGVFCYGIYGFASVIFVNSIVKDDQKVRGQSLVTLSYSSGIGGVIGNIVGGIMIDALGIKNLCLFSFIGSSFAVMIMALCYKKYKSAAH